MTRRRSIWNSPSRYGTYEGPRGTPEQWRESYAAMTGDEARVIVDKDSPWTILGVEPTDDLEALRKAFKKRVREVHPDLGGSEEETKRVIAAWTLIQEALK